MATTTTTSIAMPTMMTTIPTMVTTMTIITNTSRRGAHAITWPAGRDRRAPTHG